MKTNTVSRREYLGLLLAGMVIPGLYAQPSEPHFITRGVVLYPWDLTLTDWPERAARAGITTIALHAARRLDVLIEYIQSGLGKRFLDECRSLDIQVEYELHAMGALLSRELFYSPGMDMFRMDETGKRNPDGNCCPSSREALTRICEKAVTYGRLLKPSSGVIFIGPMTAVNGAAVPDVPA